MFEFYFFKIAISKFKIAPKCAIDKRKTDLAMARSENVSFFDAYMAMNINRVVKFKEQIHERKNV